MITEKVYGNLRQAKICKSVDYVLIDWFERDKKVLRKPTASGEEIGIRIESALNDGDIIYEDEDRIIAVEIMPCDLILIYIDSMLEMGRLCFELGNRHLALAISNDTVKCPFDQPTFEYLGKLGFKVTKVCEKFEGYIECKSHSHADTHNNIHDHHCHEE